MNIELKINPFIRFCDVIPNPCTSVGFVKAYDCRLFYIISYFSTKNDSTLSHFFFLGVINATDCFCVD